MFLEASALTGENVEEAFLKCAKSILAKIETGKCMCVNLCTHHQKRLHVFHNVRWVRSNCIYFVSGELDPEQIGSGIQYGDATSRRLNREGNTGKRVNADCAGVSCNI